jgi:hypothetical protein
MSLDKSIRMLEGIIVGVNIDNIPNNNLLAEMIAFSVIDGRLHEREYQFVWIVTSKRRGGYSLNCD